MNTIPFNQYGLAELNFDEQGSTNGGGTFTDGVAGWAIGKVLDYVWDHRSQIYNAAEGYAYGAGQQHII